MSNPPNHSFKAILQFEFPYVADAVFFSVNEESEHKRWIRTLAVDPNIRLEASLAHLKKKTKPNPGAVTRRDKSNQGKNIKSLNSPQVKHNYSPINRTSGLGVDIHLGRGCGRRKFRYRHR